MEHSKRSVELCGWAVVYDGSAEGVGGFCEVVSVTEVDATRQKTLRLITEEDATETEESCENAQGGAYYIKSFSR